MTNFNYDEAFSRNIGWVTSGEQRVLGQKRIAIAGLGGTGGSLLISLARLGVGRFTISDLDKFEIANFNRQYGANLLSIDQPKAEVMKNAALNINPDLDIKVLSQGITEANLDEFLDGVDLYVDGLDFFALDMRRKVFQRCYDKGIPAITAAPIGMGSAMLIFMPGQMSFEEYFSLNGYDFNDQLIKFVVGISPTLQHRHYVADKSTTDLLKKKVPSTIVGIELAVGMTCANALKILLNRGDVVCAPHGLHFDAYRNKLKKTWRPWGNRNPLQILMFRFLKRQLLRR